jgi:hypothetical protein
LASPNVNATPGSAAPRVQFTSPPSGPAAAAPSTHTSGNSGYSFNRTLSGTVEVFQNGQRISTTTSQNAASTYGYQIPVVPVAPESVGVAPAPTAGRFNFAPIQPAASSNTARIGNSAHDPQGAISFPTKQSSSLTAFPPTGSSGIAHTTPSTVPENKLLAAQTEEIARDAAKTAIGESAEKGLERAIQATAPNVISTAVPAAERAAGPIGILIELFTPSTVHAPTHGDPALIPKE